MSGLLLVSIFLAAQGRDLTLHVDVGIVSLDVSVTDQSGRPIEGLSASDFRVFDEGIEQEIRYFGSSTLPYHVYLLFDSSGSTRYKWDFMKSAVARFVDYIRPEDQVAMGVFDSRWKTLMNWKDSRTETLDRLEPLGRVEPSGTTQFYRSLERTIEESFDHISDRRAVVVLTDGRDTSLYREIVRHNRIMVPDEDKRFGDVYNTANKLGIPIYIIALNTDRNLEGNEGRADEYHNLQILYRGSSVPDEYLRQVRFRMEAIAQASGGQILFPRNVGDVMPLFEQIAQSLGSAYSLGWVPAPASEGAGARSIMVEVDTPNVQVRQSRSAYQPR